MKIKDLWLSDPASRRVWL